MSMGSDIMTDCRLLNSRFFLTDLDRVTRVRSVLPRMAIPVIVGRGDGVDDEIEI